MMTAYPGDPPCLEWTRRARVCVCGGGGGYVTCPRDPRGHWPPRAAECLIHPRHGKQAAADLQECQKWAGILSCSFSVLPVSRSGQDVRSRRLPFLSLCPLGRFCVRLFFVIGPTVHTVMCRGIRESVGI